MIKNKIALIAGGNGLTGSELAKKIIDYEAKVFVVDKNKKITNNFKKYSKNRNFISMVEDFGKINEIDLSIKKIIDKFSGLDAIIHDVYPKL